MESPDGDRVRLNPTYGEQKLSPRRKIGEGSDARKPPPNVDSSFFAPIKCSLASDLSRPCGSRGANMSLVKIIIITLAVILTILFLGRFLF